MSVDVKSYEIKDPAQWLSKFRHAVDYLLDFSTRYTGARNMLQNILKQPEKVQSELKSSIFVPNLFTLGFLIESIRSNADKSDEAVLFFRKLMYTEERDLQIVYSVQNALISSKPVSATELARIHTNTQAKLLGEPTLKSIGIYLQQNGLLPADVIPKLQSLIAATVGRQKRKRAKGPFNASDLDDDEESLSEPSPSKPRRTTSDLDEYDEEGIVEAYVSVRKLKWNMWTFVLFVALVLPISIVALVYGAQELQHKNRDCNSEGSRVKFSIALWLVVLGSVGTFASVIALFDYYLTMPSRRKSSETEQQDLNNTITTVRWIILLGLLFVLSWVVTGAVLYAEHANHSCRKSASGKVALSAIVIHGVASVLSIFWVLWKTKCFDYELW